MTWRRIPRVVVPFCIAVALSTSFAYAQQGNGVVVDADGVLRTRVVYDASGYMTRQRLAAARATLPPELARASRLRKISLNRLEAIVAERMATGQGLTSEMRYLAGLTGISHVFLYPDTGDVVVAGPAEGFMDEYRRPRGRHPYRAATLQLEDLVVALRAFPPAGQPTKALLVSIDPTQEGLAADAAVPGPTSVVGSLPRDAGRIASGLKENLGLQTVRIEGISPKTHFAQVLVEADYRMKLIGIGLEQPPVRIDSYVQRASPRSVARNALQRWYFTPNYDCVRVSQDETGDGVGGRGRQADQRERICAGQRDAGRQPARSIVPARCSCERSRPSTRELAEHEPVYAQLRNLIDMSIAAAFIQQNDYYGQAGWNMEVFGDEAAFPVETYNAPTKSRRR